MLFDFYNLQWQRFGNTSSMIQKRELTDLICQLALFVYFNFSAGQQKLYQIVAEFLGWYFVPFPGQAPGL